MHGDANLDCTCRLDVWRGPLQCWKYRAWLPVGVSCSRQAARGQKNRGWQGWLRIWWSRGCKKFYSYAWPRPPSWWDYQLWILTCKLCLSPCLGIALDSRNRSIGFGEIYTKCNAIFPPSQKWYWASRPLIFWDTLCSRWYVWLSRLKCSRGNHSLLVCWQHTLILLVDCGSFWDTKEARKYARCKDKRFGFFI